MIEVAGAARIGSSDVDATGDLDCTEEAGCSVAGGCPVRRTRTSARDFCAVSLFTPCANWTAFNKDSSAPPHPPFLGVSLPVATKPANL